MYQPKHIEGFAVSRGTIDRMVFENFPKPHFNTHELGFRYSDVNVAPFSTFLYEEFPDYGQYLLAKPIDARKYDLSSPKAKGYEEAETFVEAWLTGKFLFDTMDAPQQILWWLCTLDLIPEGTYYIYI